MINQLRDRARRTATLTAVAAAAALTAALLAGCTSTPEAAPQPTNETSTSASAPASTPASSAPASTAATSASSKTDSGSSDGKPSKDEVITGLVDFYTSSQGMAKAQATKFATCMVDEMYDKASAKTLKAMQEGKAENIDPDDASLFASAGVACAKKAV